MQGAKSSWVFICTIVSCVYENLFSKIVKSLPGDVYLYLVSTYEN